MGHRGLSGRARCRRARDIRATDAVVVATLARGCDSSGAVRAEPDLAMAARLAVLRCDPAASRKPEGLHRSILAVRRATSIVDECCARAFGSGRRDRAVRRPEARSRALPCHRLCCDDRVLLRPARHQLLFVPGLSDHVRGRRCFRRAARRLDHAGLDRWLRLPSAPCMRRSRCRSSSLRRCKAT